MTIGLLLITPALAHVDGFRHLWNDHIKPKLANPGTINNARNPVDWTKLKNVPAGFADGVDDSGAGGGGLGAITVRTASVAIAGADAHNGAYVLDSVSRDCNPGETAISWSAFWDGDLQPGAAGGSDDKELTIASVEFSQADQGYTLWGGNDSGVNHTLTLQVQCMAAA
ncbi:MAG: hypothetical protein WD965_09785 [Actinomycetota bacterium]